jgi:hypothetical protein
VLLSPKKLLSDVNNFKQHVGRFPHTMPQYQSLKQYYVGISPVLDAEQRAILTGHDIILARKLPQSRVAGKHCYFPAPQNGT